MGVDGTLSASPELELTASLGPMTVADRRAEAIWVSDDRLRIDGVQFTVTADSDRYLNERPRPDHFIVAKQTSMVCRLLALLDELSPSRIVELGIFRGGSAALLAAAARPAKLTAIELETEPVQALERFIEDRSLETVLVPHYGIDQGDAAQLAATIDADHADEPLDLVIDDASHLYRETRCSFELLFARLRPGGCYIIEDWGWAHFPDPLWQSGGGWFHDRPALTNLIVELLMVAATGPELITGLAVERDTVTVTRGPLELAGPLALEQHYCNRGLPFRPLM